MLLALLQRLLHLSAPVRRSHRRHHHSLTGALPESRARKYMRQLGAAMRYCHCVMHVVHRDLKLDNLLLDASDNILLADFG